MSTGKKFTMDEVKANYHKKSLWVVINKSVYDLTKFQNEHPGGEDILRDMAGKDASEEFEDIGHSSTARNQMTKYKIGELA
ncbi:cytochrome b5 [Sergentomyia squamirostris]